MYKIRQKKCKISKQQIICNIGTDFHTYCLYNQYKNCKKYIVVKTMHTNRNRLTLSILITLLIFLPILQSTQADPIFDGQYLAISIKQEPIKQTIQLILSGTTMNINGCNQRQLSFTPTKYNNNNSRDIFQFYLVGSTGYDCTQSSDDVLLQAFMKVKYMGMDGQNYVVFKDGKGRQYVRIKRIKQNVEIVEQGEHYYNRTQFNNNRHKLSDIVSSALTHTSESSMKAGNYSLFVAPIGLDITANQYIVRGCNSYEFRYSRQEITGEVVWQFVGSSANVNNSNSTNTSTSNRKSSSNRCDPDFDDYYIQAISKVIIVLPHGNGFNAFDESGRVILEIIKNKDSTISNTNNTNTNTNNNKSSLLTPPQYKLSFPSISLQISTPDTPLTPSSLTPSLLRIQGCNNHYYNYQIIDNLIFIDKHKQTYRNCLFYNYDGLINQSMLMVDVFNVVADKGDGIEFKYGDKVLLTATALLKEEDISDPEVVAPLYSAKLALKNNNEVLSADVLELPKQKIQTTLKGTYKLQAVGTDTPIIIIKFDDNYLQFQSCTLIRLPYVAYRDGVFNLLQGGSLTNRTCAVNYDQVYIKALLNSKAYNKTSSGYFMYRIQAVPLVVLSVNIRNQLVYSSMINGGYQLSLSGIDFWIQENKIKFSGCNTHIVPFTVKNDGSSATFSPNISTRRPCINDTDQYYLQAIYATRTINYISQGLSFIDQNGFQRLKLLDFMFSPKMPQYPYDSRYKAQLSGAGMRLKISNGQFILSGCSQYRFKFTIYDGGDIVFGSVSSTPWQCHIQNDVVFLFTILKTRDIAVSKNSLLFVNSQGDMVLKAINNDILPDQNIPLTTTSTFKNAKRIYFRAGPYRLIFLRTSLTNYTIMINNQIFIFSGCNTFTIPYTAYANGTVKFVEGNSTKRVCQQNYDNLYIQAFMSIRSFIDQSGIYTLFNQNKVSVFNIITKSGNLRNQVTWGSTGTGGTTGSGSAGGSSPILVGRTQSQPAPIAIDDSSLTLLQVSPTVDNPVLFLSQLTSPLTYRPAPNSLIKSLSGSYNISLPEVSLTIFNDTMLIKGCNSYRVPYTTDRDQIVFGKEIQAKSDCSFDNTKYYVSLLSQIKSFKKQGRITYFYNTKLQEARANSATTFSIGTVLTSLNLSSIIKPSNSTSSSSTPSTPSTPSSTPSSASTPSFTASTPSLPSSLTLLNVTRTVDNNAPKSDLNRTAVTTGSGLPPFVSSTLGSLLVNLTASPTVDLRQAPPTLDLGIYTIRIPQVALQMNDYQAKIFFCDIDTIGYEARQSGFVTFTRQDKQRQNQCDKQYKRTVREHLYSTSNFIKNGEKYILRDIRGYPRVILQPKKLQKIRQNNN